MDLSFLENCIIGICDAAPLEEERQRLLDSPTSFVTSDIDKRIDPSLSLPGVKSVIVLGKPYEPSPTNNLSSLAYGTDYHLTVKELLTQLASQLNCNSLIMVDSGPLYERAFAVKAGLGFWGKNGMVISTKLGSYFNIGLLLVDIVLPYTSPIQDKCPDDCQLCLDACANNAIGSPMDCASYHTQKKSAPTLEKINGQIYGCDICQACCPFNIKAERSIAIDPEIFLKMEDEEFSKKYGHTSMAWRGLKHIKRNANILKGNI